MRMHLKLVRIEYSHLENIQNLMHLYNIFFICVYLIRVLGYLANFFFPKIFFI